MKRYFISSDHSGHDYAVPVEIKYRWYKWLELDEDDPKAWDVPEGAIFIDGDFTFTDPLPR